MRTYQRSVVASAARVVVLVVSTNIALVTALPATADGVDLRGKSGVPRDLKQYDPPAKSLHYKEPPSPTIPREAPRPSTPYTPPYVNPTNGGLPPGGGAAGAVLAQPRPAR